MARAKANMTRLERIAVTLDPSDLPCLEAVSKHLSRGGGKQWTKKRDHGCTSRIDAANWSPWLMTWSLSLRLLARSMAPEVPAGEDEDNQEHDAAEDGDGLGAHFTPPLGARPRSGE
jgi:hypothetical protein